ncbi:MAG: LamG domain-containing protein, partial [Deltaproteobacteria bacterium]|nr:LamG domain-containing protein [Deltaproteobacteria bacterium]
MAENKVNMTLKFDGKDDHIRLAPASDLGLTNSDFTVEAWITILDFAGESDKTVLGTDQGGKNKGLHLVVRNKKPFMGFYGNDTAGKTELTTGAWSHIVWRYTKKGGKQAIFVNGVLDAATQGHAPFQGADVVNMGRWSGGRYFNGFISDVRIWNMALTSGEIVASMNRRLAGNEAGLMSYWPLDEGAGDVVRNAKQALHGVIRGAKWV